VHNVQFKFGKLKHRKKVARNLLEKRLFLESIAWIFVNSKFQIFENMCKNMICICMHELFGLTIGHVESENRLLTYLKILYRVYTVHLV